MTLTQRMSHKSMQHLTALAMSQLFGAPTPVYLYVCVCVFVCVLVCVAYIAAAAYFDTKAAKCVAGEGNRKSLEQLF